MLNPHADILHNRSGQHTNPLDYKVHVLFTIHANILAHAVDENIHLRWRHSVYSLLPECHYRNVLPRKSLARREFQG